MGLLVTVGAPGAGKSTWAKKHLSEDTLRLERDRFRECIFGTRRAYHEHPFDRDDRSQVITEAMLAAMIFWPKRRWAVTDTGITYPAVKPFIQHARRTGAKVTLVIFERTPDLLLSRNKTRPENERIDEALLGEMYAAFAASDAWWRQINCEKVYVA